MPSGATASFTDCGLPGVRQVPYGVHMCHFYKGREDLAEALVPYFSAGLRNRGSAAPPISSTSRAATTAPSTGQTTAGRC